MNEFNKLRDEIILALKTCPAEIINNARILSRYNYKNRVFPVKKSLICVGIGGIEMFDGAIGDYYGELNANSIMGKEAAINIVFDIYNKDSNVIGEIFALLAGYLLLENTCFNFDKFVCDDIGYSDENMCMHLRINACIKACVSKTQPHVSSSEIMLIRKEI